MNEHHPRQTSIALRSRRLQCGRLIAHVWQSFIKHFHSRMSGLYLDMRVGGSDWLQTLTGCATARNRTLACKLVF